MIKKILAYFDQRRQEERQHQLQMLQILVEQQREGQENSLKILDRVITEVLEATKNQNRIFEQWLGLFKVTELPTSSVVREEDEVAQERERMKALGYPVDAEVEEQMKWIVKSLGEDDL